MFAEQKKKPNYTKEQFIPFVKEFYNEQKEFKERQERFNTIKQLFYNDVKELFNYEGIDKLVVDNEDLEGNELVVNRVQKTSVIFDIDALENNLSKEMSKDVIDKSYTITDINRLIIYLKSCGVDPKVFKSFINVTKTVDEKKLDKLADLGLIRKEQLEGCYTLKRKKPYFTVRMKRGKHDEEPKETKAATAENEG
nr:MAG: hypothetical protein [Bacteriophage sp.]